MAKTGPIVIIEDDADDKSILEEVLRDLNVPNEIIWFEGTEEAYNYLCTTTESIFLIFCDINLPGLNGLEFKRTVDAVPELRRKSIPFLFYSTTATQKDVNEAYTEMTVQGFFTKGSNYPELKRLIGIILDYWMSCRHPNF
ncbi:MAG TPA: response regulator [Flavobacterium sp.]|jgi:CheY-like chemotaxis protein